MRSLLSIFSVLKTLICAVTSWTPYRNDLCMKNKWSKLQGAVYTKQTLCKSLIWLWKNPLPSDILNYLYVITKFICKKEARPWKEFWVRKEKRGHTEIWTRIIGFKVQCDNPYTIRPWVSISTLKAIRATSPFFQQWATLGSLFFVYLSTIISNINLIRKTIYQYF